MPLPEQAMLELDAMDAALRGESVDPEFADVAELALMLAGSRPELGEDAAYRLDLRVSGLASEPEPRPWYRRFGFASAVRSAPGTVRRRPLILRPAFGAGLAVVVALVVVVVLVGRGGGGTSDSAQFEGVNPGTHGATFAAAPTAASTTAAASANSASVGSSSSGAVASSGSAGGAGLTALKPVVQNVAPTPQSNGRKTIQSSQLTLATPGAKVSTVSQELFTVVGSEQGIVKHSQVNSGTGASASFTLSIPAANLAVTLARLDQLRYATVASSTSSTADVNSQYLDNQRALADAKALRSSLLTQLQAASTTAAIDSLKVQIHDAESTIASDESTVNTLNGKIAYSSVTVQIEAGSTPVVPGAHHRGFTLSKAAHDALKVLTDVGGGALIALAVLLPLGVLVALAAWLSSGWRRRSRERALDAA